MPIRGLRQCLLFAPCSLLFDSWRNSGTHNTKATSAAPDVGSAVVPVGNLAEGRIEVPTAPPDHPVRARSGPRGIVYLTCTDITVVPVPTPLHHVPAHVMQLRKVCRLCPYLMGTIISMAASYTRVGISLIPCHVSNRTAPRIGIAPVRGISWHAALGRVFPLRLCGQTAPSVPTRKA
jgi:hypothetical protein